MSHHVITSEDTVHSDLYRRDSRLASDSVVTSEGQNWPRVPETQHSTLDSRCRNSRSILVLSHQRLNTWTRILETRNSILIHTPNIQSSTRTLALRLETRLRFAVQRPKTLLRFVFQRLKTRFEQCRDSKLAPDSHTETKDWNQICIPETQDSDTTEA